MEALVLSAEYSEDSSGRASHYHDCHQILYITSGSAEITVGGREYSVCKGAIVLISRLEQHSIRVKSRPYHRWLIEISPEAPSKSGSFASLLSVLVNRPACFKHAIETREKSKIFEEIIKNICNEKNSQLEFSDEMADSGLYQLLVMLYRIYPELFIPISDGTDIIRKIQLQFESNCADNYTLTGLSREYGLSIFYLCHLFKSVTGYSVMEHLGSCRIAAAKKYLAETDKSIGEIVELCGFSNSSNFSRKFKEITAMSPSNFRKKYRI